MKSILPLEIILIEDDGYHLMIEVLINGKVANMLIDTGASRTVFDISKIRKFLTEQNFEPNNKLSTGLGTNSLESKTTIIHELELGKISIKYYKSIVIDLEHVNKSYKLLNLPEIDGVLGSDLLFRYNGIIYYDKGILKLSD